VSIYYDVDTAYMPACMYTMVMHQDAGVAPGDGDPLEMHQDAGVWEYAKDGSALPVITCKTSKGNIKGSTCTIHGDSEIVYSADKPLACGAKVWIQTTAPVTIDGVKYN
jgi:hypothetical protein